VYARRVRGPLALAGVLLGIGTAGHADSIPPQPVDGKIAWIYNYAEGQRLARQTGKPLFVLFRCER
jgi:hypothetical protein